MVIKYLFVNACYMLEIKPCARCIIIIIYNDGLKGYLIRGKIQENRQLWFSLLNVIQGTWAW